LDSKMRAPRRAGAANQEAAAMRRAAENPDRNFAADGMEPPDVASLRALLQSSDVADYFDAAVRRRIGEAISRAVFDPGKPNW